MYLSRISGYLDNLIQLNKKDKATQTRLLEIKNELMSNYKSCIYDSNCKWATTDNPCDYHDQYMSLT